MKRPLLLLLLAILVAGGIALHARRAAARDRELAELLAGPFLPGATVVGNPWFFGISTGPGDECECPVSGETILVPGAVTPADLVVTRASSTDPDGAFAGIHWTVRAGSPTESRFFGFLRTARNEGLLVPAGPGEAIADDRHRFVWQGISTDGFTEDAEFANYSKALNEGDVRGFRERVSRFFETEAARGDVVVREERGASLWFDFHDRFRTEPPGLFRRAVGWVCDAIGRPELYSVSKWAERKRAVPDPLLPLAGRSFAIVPGAPREGRLYRFSFDSSEKEPPRVFTVADGTPLADAFRSLCAKYEPWTLGTPVPPLTPSKLHLADKTMLQGKTGTNEWAVAFDRPTPRLRAFLTDLLRLLATPSPGADEPPAESAE
jgi:hypothetical protein